MVPRVSFVAAGLVCLAVATSAAGTPALGPYDLTAEVTGSARVGDELVVIATLKDHGEGEGALLFQLETPDWVEVASSRQWPLETVGGETYRRAWVLTATQEGVWSAEITARDPETQELKGPAWTGIKAWSAQREGRWVAGNEAWQLFPEVGGGTGRLTAREVAPDVYNVTYDAMATALWLRGQNLTMHLGRWVGASAVPVDRTDSGVDVAWSERGVIRGQLVIDKGAERAHTSAALYATVVFPGAVTWERVELVTVDCRTITVLPGWQANLPPQGERACGQGSAWHSSGPGASALVLVLVVLALLVALVYRRPRPPTGSPSPACGTV